MMMRLPSRHVDWEPRLIAVQQAWASAKHQPKPGHDCAAFVLAVIEAVTGERLLFDGITPYRTEAGQSRALRQLGWAGLMDAADACLGGRIPPAAAHRGDVVSDGQTLGVMGAAGPVAFGHDGLVAMGGLVAAWPVGRCDG